MNQGKDNYFVTNTIFKGTIFVPGATSLLIGMEQGKQINLHLMFFLSNLCLLASSLTMAKREKESL